MRCFLWFGFHIAMAISGSCLAQAQGSNEPQSELVADAVDDPYTPIDPVVIDQYFSIKPTKFVIDPQGLIPSQKRTSVETILKNHSVDSLIDLYLFVFGKNQKLPEEGKHLEFATRHFAQGKAVLMIYYYYENPSRTQIVMSPSIAESISNAEQQRAVQSSVIRAARSNGSYEELEEFLMQFSVRTYWMERMMNETSEETTEPVIAEKAVDETEANTISNPLEMIPVRFRKPVLTGLGVAGGILVLWALIVWLKSRAKHQFPEIEVETRLGGSHAAGIGAVVNFASPAVSPALQREQVPEYLSRA